MGSVVIGGQRSLGGFGGGPVVPDASGHGQQPLGDAGIQAAGGTAAVAFEVELALEGVVDRFDPLPDPADRAVPGVSSRRSGRMNCSPKSWLARASKSRPARPLSPIRISPGRSAPVRAAGASSPAA